MDPLSTPAAQPHRDLAHAVMMELRALSTTQDRLDQYAANRLGLNRTDLRALDLIGQSGVISPTALAAALGMSTGATSTVLDRLEAAGYAIREPDPAHRRRTQVRTTSRSQELSAAIFTPIIRGTIAQAAAYPGTVLAAIARFLADHRALLDNYLQTAPPASPGQHRT
jgi:DNA-binding MarR family transcriptional regulator